MAKIELELNDETLERARRLAEQHHETLDAFVDDATKQKTKALRSDPIWGMFADEPELVDRIIEAAMEAREKHPLRLTDE